jgi:hypothetical protein
MTEAIRIRPASGLTAVRIPSVLLVAHAPDGLHRDMTAPTSGASADRTMLDFFLMAR